MIVLLTKLVPFIGGKNLKSQYIFFSKFTNYQRAENHIKLIVSVNGISLWKGWIIFGKKRFGGGVREGRRIAKKKKKSDGHFPDLNCTFLYDM